MRLVDSALRLARLARASRGRGVPTVAASSAEPAPVDAAVAPADGEVVSRHWRRVRVPAAQAEELFPALPIAEAHDATTPASLVQAQMETDPLLGALVASAERHRVTFGVYGGTARDLLLAETRAATSDVDLVFDSRVPGFAAFKEEAVALFAVHAPDTKIDWAVDLAKPVPWGSNRGATIDKLAVMSDGTVYDFSSRALDDLASRSVRMFTRESRGAPLLADLRGARLSHVARALKLVGRYPGFGFDAATTAAVRDALAAARTDGSIERLAAHWQGVAAAAPGGLTDAQMSAAHQAYKRQRREPRDGDVIEIAHTLRKMAKGLRHPEQVRRALYQTGFGDALVAMGLGRELRAIVGDVRADNDAAVDALAARGAHDTVGLALDVLDAEAKVRADGRQRSQVAAARASLAMMPALPATLNDAVALVLTRGGMAAMEAHRAAARAVEHLTHKRAGGTFTDRFAVGACERLEDDGALLPLRARQVGGTADVRAIDPAATHSMHDVDAYVRARLWPAVVKDVIDNGRVVELCEGSKHDALRDLARRGFTSVRRVEMPKAERFGQLHMVENESTGELRYVMSEIHGADRVTHMQLLWRFAKSDGRRFDLEQLHVVTQPLRADVEVYRNYTRAVGRAARRVDSALVGFVNGFDRELELRQRASDLAAVLSAPAASRALAQARMSPVLRAALTAADAPAAVFASRALAVELGDVARTPALAPLVAHLPANASVQSRPVDSDELDQRVVSFFDADGRRKTLVMARMPYGELARSLGTALVDRGATSVVVAGTAGGLREDHALGDVLTPERFTEPSGGHVNVTNALARGAGSTTALVKSPLAETRAEIVRMATNNDAVEMEAGHFAAALAGTGVSYGAISIVSDVPGSDLTLESHLADDAVKAAFAARTDDIVAALGIRRLAPTATGRTFGDGCRFARALEVVDALAPRARGPEHSVMRYTLARYVLNGLPWSALTNVPVADAVRRPEELGISARWMEKINRDVAAPYTDASAFAALAAQEQRLQESAHVLLSAGVPADAALWLMGGITKGRFGAASDLDLLVEHDDPAVVQRALRSKVGALHPDADDVRTGELGHARVRNEKYASFERLGLVGDIAAHGADLRALLTRKLAEGGVQVGVDDHLAYTADAVTFAREVPESDELMLEIEKSFTKTMKTDALLPLVGAAIDGAELRSLTRADLAQMGRVMVERLLVAGHLDADALALFLRSPAASRFWQSQRAATLLQAAGAESATAWLATTPRLGDAVRAFDLVDLCDAAGLADPLDRAAVVIAGFDDVARGLATGRVVPPAGPGGARGRVDPSDHAFADWKEGAARVVDGGEQERHDAPETLVALRLRQARAGFAQRT